MLTTLVLVAFAFLAALAVYFVLGTLHLRRQARSKNQDIQWALVQLNRALNQVESHDEDEILLGLQTISALHHPIRLRSLPRLAELSHSQNFRVARQARDTIDKIGQRTESKGRTEKEPARVAS